MITVIHILIGPWGTTSISKRIDNMGAGSDCKNSEPSNPPFKDIFNYRHRDMLPHDQF